MDDQHIVILLVFLYYHYCYQYYHYYKLVTQCLVSSNFVARFANAAQTLGNFYAIIIKETI